MAPADQVDRHVRRGLSWNLAGAISTNAIRIVVIAVLGRELTASDFGIVAAAISVNVILHGIRDIGIGRALIQREHLDEGHIRTSFAVSTYLGIVLNGVLIATAPLIGRFYHIPASVPVLRVLAIQFTLRGISATSRNLCERHMNFRAVALIDAGTFATGSLASIVFALAGFGPWSLVIGYLVEEGLATLAYLVVTPPLLAVAIDRVKLRELMSFGTGQTFTQIFATLATYGDNFVVGETLGASELGFYTRAYDLIKFPAMVFEAIVGKVLFPAFSRFQSDRERLAASFHRGMFANALVLLPASALVVVLSPEIIRVLVGAGWDSSVLPLQILAVSILPRTSQKLGVIVTQAAGRSNAVAVANAIYMTAVIGGASLSIRWGIPGVACSTALAIFIVFSHCTYLGMSISGLRFRDLVRAHVPGLLLAGLVCATALPAVHLLRNTFRSAPLIVTGVSMIAIVPWFLVGGAWILRGRGDFAWLREELRRMRRRNSHST